jgi:F-type H+-transporting ATPase subunit delta
MTHASIARRYAGVLFDITQSRGTTDRALKDLQAIRDLVAGHEQLRQVFDTPLLAPQKKRQILEGLLDAATPVSDEVRRLLLLMADRDRLMLIPSVASALSERVMRFQNILPAHVVTAVPLTDDRRAALAVALAKAVGCQVTMHERVDPAIIGGVIARVGSTVFDASVTRQIEKLRASLGAEG